MALLKNWGKKAIRNTFHGHFPSFLIVGAQKAGSTSLHYYLSQHPELGGSPLKEVRYFDRDSNYSRGEEWYKKTFIQYRNPFRKHKHYFESTPEYLYRSYVPKRIYEYNPKIKIVILIREPIKRAFSAWQMYRNFKNREKLPHLFLEGYIENQPNNLYTELYKPNLFPSFDDVVRGEIKRYLTGSIIEEPGLIRRGIYYEQIQKYITLFGRENICIIGFKDLIGSNMNQELNKVLELIELPPSDWSFLKKEPQNIGKYKEPMTKEIKEELTDFYASHNTKLFDLLGYKPNW